MQLHNLQPEHTGKSRRRVGRGGKRGTYSGRGMKGQKSRAGASQKAGFRGGDKPLWKAFPKQRGATKKVAVKHRTFSITRTKPFAVNLTKISKYFKEGEVVNKLALIKRGVIPTGKNGVKILGTGELDKKVTFEGVKISKSAVEKIKKSSSVIKVEKEKKAKK